MRCVTLSHETDLDQWREVVRPLLSLRVPCKDLGWHVGPDPQDLFSNITEPPEALNPKARSYPVRITKSQLELCRRILCHIDPARLYHLYATLLRLQTDSGALDDPTFSSGRWVLEADQAIRRDRHKMHAFVRFKKLGERESESGLREVFAAWFEPDHRIVELTAAFFARRFTGMDWSILTPHGCSHWNGKSLSISSGVDKSEAPGADDTEAAWTTYYSSIFNPSRVKIGAMLSEMPKKYWKNLPEAAVIPQLIQQAEAQKSGFMSAPETSPHKLTDKVTPDVYAFRAAPETIKNWDDAKQAAARCTRCDLHRCATQTIFGEGPLSAKLMLVGEQPGDQEDLAGRPFIGPAGQLLDDALTAAGLERGGLYVTNAVKHFKFEPHGKRRLHRNPVANEIERCRSWLDLERQFIRPHVILALGKTALRALTGHRGNLKSARGQVFQGANGEQILATIHPSFLLRLPDVKRRDIEYRRFVEDLARAHALAVSPKIGKKEEKIMRERDDNVTNTMDKNL